ncbi:MAG: ABC transporter substrate-binding protein [Acidimicrobiales bacterium]|nr:ABC transporter substrate-binding protein [Acidimicrobiales bacterium]
MLAASTLLVAGCGDDSSGGAVAQRSDLRIDQIGEAVESGLPEDAKPVRGGQIVYGLEAETSHFCLSSAQVAVSGMQVMRAIYDPLVVPDAEGNYRPYLADSVEPDATYETWTIKLRPGIVFHDESPLTAEVVKNNLDAYRGEYPGRSSDLFLFAFDNIESISVVNELTLKVSTKVPWVAFRAALYNSGRVGIMAQAQLDADVDRCETHPVGTGPFEFVSWTYGDSLNVVSNPDYWQDAPDGEPYPYVDAIEFRPIPNADQRLSALVQGDINMLHTSVISDMVSNLPDLVADGAVNTLVSDDFTETAYTMFNVAEPPFDRREARIAFAHAVDRNKLNEVANKGGAALADGPFPPGVPGYVEESGRPGYDPEKAKAMVADLKAEGVDMSFTFLDTADPASLRATVLAVEMLEEAGFEVKLVIEDEETLIERAIAGDFQAAAFRNQPGDDPDMNYMWWYGEGNPVNFARFDDPVINEALRKGRSEPDEEERRELYEAIHQQMAQEVYYSYNWYVPWAVAEAANVHGILGPDLPSGHASSTRLGSAHPLHGVWISN